jgi:CheY-like chemotaxis protein
VLHELATNAAKYGALSQTKGRISLNWQWQNGKLDLQWNESGGPPVKAPATKGYGTKVITASVMQQLGGTANFDWQPDGLRFTMSIAIGDRVNAAQKPPRRRREPAKARANGAAVASAEPQPQRILLVEDEALVGMMMSDWLTEIGFHVVGPFGKVSDAIEAIDGQRFQAAVLDINLRGEMIYTLADELTGRGVPIVFVTGYGSEAIDQRFANIPVLQKPVDSAALRRVLMNERHAADA